MEITVRRWEGKIRLIISVDDNSVGGYHNEGGGDQTWHNVLMIWQKKMTWLKLLLMPVMIVVFCWHSFNHRDFRFYIFCHNSVEQEGCLHHKILFSFLHFRAQSLIWPHEYSTSNTALGYQHWCHSLAFILNLVWLLTLQIKLGLHGHFITTRAKYF